MSEPSMEGGKPGEGGEIVTGKPGEGGEIAQYIEGDFTYHYNNVLAISVDGTDLPDPSSWAYTVGDLDSSGSRDANGLLHRCRVATKINYEFEWNGIEWKMLERILDAVNAEKFTLRAPDPRYFNRGYTGSYYVGDRTGNCIYLRSDKEEIAVYSLKLKFIEY